MLGEPSSSALPSHSVSDSTNSSPTNINVSANNGSSLQWTSPSSSFYGPNSAFHYPSSSGHHPSWYDYGYSPYPFPTTPPVTPRAPWSYSSQVNRVGEQRPYVVKFLNKRIKKCRGCGSFFSRKADGSNLDPPNDLVVAHEERRAFAPAVLCYEFMRCLTRCQKEISGHAWLEQLWNQIDSRWWRCVVRVCVCARLDISIWGLLFSGCASSSGSSQISCLKMIFLNEQGGKENLFCLSHLCCSWWLILMECWIIVAFGMLPIDYHSSEMLSSLFWWCSGSFAIKWPLMRVSLLMIWPPCQSICHVSHRLAWWV